MTVETKLLSIIEYFRVPEYVKFSFGDLYDTLDMQVFNVHFPAFIFRTVS